LTRHLTERQRKVMVALYRGQAFRRGMGCSVRSLVERRFLTDSRYAGPLAGLEEAGLVASDRKPVNRSRAGFSLWWLTSLGRGTAQGLSNGYTDREPPDRTVRLLEADRALAQALDERSRLEAAPRAVAEVVAVQPGAWNLEPRQEDWRRGLGLLVLEGLLAGEVKVKKRSFLELLGPGDLLRPWTSRPEFAPSLAAPAKWEVLTLARFAVLDRELALRLAPWPEVTGVLLDRAVERSRSLAVQFALRQEGQVEERVRFALWHLARRWGEPEGKRVVVRVGPLSPHVLGRMAATTPESAASALQRLQERGVVEQVEAGGWRIAQAGRP
jgi:CRP/FNR family transcriptional regulator, cyclic AMP receptor protein